MRRLGILVRDHTMCPLRVHSWMDIEKEKLEHMWNVVMGGKDGKPPNMDTIFFETRKKESLLNLKQMQNMLRSKSWFNLIHLLPILKSLKSALDLNVRVMWLDLVVE